MPVVSEPTTSSDLTNYQITNAARRYLDSTAGATLEFSVNAGATWNPVVNSGTSAYTIQWVGGWARFGVAQAAGTLIRFLSASYLAMAALGNAYDWEASLGADLEDITAFGAAAKSFFPKLRAHTGKVKQFFPDLSMYNTNFNQLLLGQFYIDATRRLEGQVYIKALAEKAAEAGMVMEDVDFQFHGDAYLIP